MFKEVKPNERLFAFRVSNAYFVRKCVLAGKSPGRTSLLITGISPLPESQVGQSSQVYFESPLKQLTKVLYKSTIQI